MNISLLSTRLRITAFLPSQPLLQPGQFRQPFSLLIATGRSPTKFRSTLKLRWFLMLAIAVFGFVAVGRTSAATFTVTSTADPGDGVCALAGVGDGCTLREAITSANLIGGDNTIAFASGVNGTIQLTNALPDLSSNITMTGPGETVLSVRGEGSTHRYRIFTIASGATVSISGLTVTNGYTADGAASPASSTTVLGGPGRGVGTAGGNIP